MLFLEGHLKNVFCLSKRLRSVVNHIITKNGYLVVISCSFKLNNSFFKKETISSELKNGLFKN